jgi:hypothetical protein
MRVCFAILILAFVGAGRDGQLPPLAKTQLIKASIGKRGNYITSGTVQGGRIVDGNAIERVRWGKHEDFERIVVEISSNWYEENRPPAVIPCYFEVAYEHYPHRLMFTTVGIRRSSASFPEFLGSNLVRDMDRIFLGDDSAATFDITFERPVEFEVFELHNPGRIVVDIRAVELGPAELPPVYSLRTASYPYGSFVGYLAEDLSRLSGKNARLLRSEDGRSLVEEGYYTSRKEAEDRKKTIEKDFKHNEDPVHLFIEKRNAEDVPGAITDPMGLPRRNRPR